MPSLRLPHMPSFVTALALCALTLPGAAASAPDTSTSAASALADVVARSDRALARADLADYRGWIKYLRFLATTASLRPGNPSTASAEAATRLAEWLDRIEANPHLLATLTGVQEWAYESRADGSGQPFKIVIPTDYDPAHPAALSMYMHGYSGNHLEHSAGWVPRAGSFDVAVLGRSRGGGYRDLSEADVLDVIAYIQAHWSVDPDRIHLNGGSMGGGGTYRLGSRYPQLFASGRPSCGFASTIPVGNLLTFPIYATHSADDPVVSVLHEVGPLAQLRALGGTVIFDETNGYGHAVWNYAAGNQRGLAWEQFQVRPPSTQVHRIDYTALDGGAVRGWWGEIAEWGDAPQPARFVLTVGANNTLHAELTNISALRVRLAESPFDSAQTLHVSVNGAVPLDFAAPLPASAVIVRTAAGWAVQPALAAAPFRLHTPGSASLLYHGDPLLIVYGTHGTVAENSAMRAAAIAASKSSNSAWVADGGEGASDGMPHSQNLYGWLDIKADTDVTEADIARCHLVLIGTTGQNSVVRRIAAQLPVKITDDEIVCSDGVTFPAASSALGLVYYNPLAPDRLIFWVASTDSQTYAAGSWIPQLMGGGDTIAPTPYGGDFVVADATKPTLVTARAFDSRWRWSDPHDGPRLPPTFAAYGNLATVEGHAMLMATGADFALVDLAHAPTDAAFAPGYTRARDLLPLFYYSPIGEFEASGAELAEMFRHLAAARPANPAIAPTTLKIVTASDAGPAETTETSPPELNAHRHYRVVIPVSALWAFSEATKMAPTSYRLASVSVAGALSRFLLADEPASAFVP
ncbi:MAG TPA: hypothetical protein VHE13_17540 [Opitutus sp.]|nr:hypothetical protein [Opitutus sp.]